MQKICIKCEVLKDTSNFYKSSAKSDGLDYYCKPCRNTNTTISHEFKSKKCSIDNCQKPSYAREYCRVHYERVRRTGNTERKTKVAVLEPYRLNEIKYKYHINIEWYKANVMGPCQICKEPQFEGPLHIEHDHACCGGAGSCGKCIRGLVCASCNTHIRHWDKGTIRKDNRLYSQIEQYINCYKKMRSMIE